MRHSRKAVMKEQYKLYMKKHIFNGRYFVRNMQILICTIVVTALLISGLVLGHMEPEDMSATNVAVDAKDALLGNSEEVKTVQEAPTTEAVEDSIPEEVTTEAVVAEVVAIEDKEEVAEQEEKSKFEDKCIADVEETLNVRKGPSTDTDFVGSMNPGAIATVLGVEGEWTKIKSGDVEGYVLSEFVKTGESAEELAQEYVTLRGTVLEDGVNIRSEKSTDAEILVVLDKDDTITVLENPEEDIVVEATAERAPEVEITEAVTEAAMNQDETTEVEDSAEDITWIPVMLADGQTGYVSAELVDVDELYEIAVSAEELQRQAAEEAARKAAEEEAARQAAAAASQSSGGSTGSNSSSKDDSATYQGAVTKPVTATESGECIGTFTITAYCGCKKCSGSKKTASGTTPTEGRTIAADTSILPYGTQVVIDGVVYTVEDCGSGVRGNHIDIFFATHEKAVAFGKKAVKVYKY